MLFSAAPSGQAASTSFPLYETFLTIVTGLDSSRPKPCVSSACWKARSRHMNGAVSALAAGKAAAASEASGPAAQAFSPATLKSEGLTSAEIVEPPFSSMIPASTARSKK